MVFHAMLSSALTSPCANEAHLRLKPYIELLTHLLANVMGQLYHILAGCLIFIDQYQRLLSMHGRAADAFSFELALID
jgi:hypothetical protein